MEFDRSHILMEELNRAIVNIYKVCIEETGYDMGVTENFIEYHNYLINTPLSINGNSGGNILLDGGEGIPYNNVSMPWQNSKFIDYKGPADGSIGSSAFPQGKGKGMDPNGIYWPFYVFGFGASPKKRPNAAKPQRSGIECCKLAINTILGYINSGCKTIGDVICKYHTGQSTYEKFLDYYSKRAGINDVADGRFVSSAEMIQRQNYYQQHLVDYTHMSNKTPITRSYKILFPLITFISRQEQGVNCEAACKIALQQMGIT